jgi:hypothetical protein
MHGVIGMLTNRKGRKRKSGKRTSSGALERKSLDFRAMASLQPHRIALPEALRAHERGESYLGCLNLLKRISEQQYESGRRFAVIVGAYRSVIGTPRGTAGTGGGYACNPDACKLDQAHCLCELRTARYRDATHALQLAGQNAYNFTYRTAVTDLECQADAMVHLRAGLDALARHFGLGRK